MTVLVAVLLVALIVFWFCFAGEWREAGAKAEPSIREPWLSGDDVRRANEARVAMLHWFEAVHTSPKPIILPCTFHIHMRDWRAEQIAPGVSRCPSDPENERGAC